LVIQYLDPLIILNLNAKNGDLNQSYEKRLSSYPFKFILLSSYYDEFSIKSIKVNNR